MSMTERAEGLKDWAMEGAEPAEVAEALVKADAAALHWEIAQLVLPPSQIEQIKTTLAHLLANGYAPPAR